MSERAGREATLEKMQELHPETENEAELTALAIQADKKKETVSGIKWIISGGVLLAAGYWLTGMLSVWLVIAVVAIAANGLRLLMNGPRIEQRYRSEPLPEEGGTLTRQRIQEDCGKALQVTRGEFYLVRTPLHDMGVDYDTGLLQLFSRYFFFRSQDGVYSLRVKKDQYRTAALGAEYYVVVPKSEEFRVQIPVRAYQAACWTLSGELTECIGEFPRVPENPEEASGKAEKEKTGKILPVISIVLSVLSLWVPLTVSPFLCLGALVLAGVSLYQGKNGWSTGAMVLSVMSLAVMLLFWLPGVMG